MAYSLPTKVGPRKRTPDVSRVSPKTHTPGPQLQERGYRYYSPELGRWASRDRAEESSGANLYHFAFNTPVNKKDLLGLTTIDSDGPTSKTDAEFITWYNSSKSGKTYSSHVYGAGAESEADTHELEFSWESSGCSPNAKKLSIISESSAKFEMRIREDYWDYSFPKTGRSLKDHERKHFDHFKDYWDSRDQPYKDWQSKCVCSACQIALEKYFEDVAAAALYKRWWDDDLTDNSDYDKPFSTTEDSYNTKKKSVDADKEKLKDLCPP